VTGQLGTHLGLLAGRVVVDSETSVESGPHFRGDEAFEGQGLLDKQAFSLFGRLFRVLVSRI